MVRFTKFRKRTGRILSALVLMTAQMTPFFVFSTPRVGALETAYFLPTSTHTPNGWGAGSLGDASNGFTNNGQYAESTPENEPQQAFSNFNMYYLQDLRLTAFSFKQKLNLMTMVLTVI